MFWDSHLAAMDVWNSINVHDFKMHKLCGVLTTMQMDVVPKVKIRQISYVNRKDDLNRKDEYLRSLRDMNIPHDLVALQRACLCQAITSRLFEWAYFYSYMRYAM